MRAYIFTKGLKYDDDFQWYIDYFESLHDAERSCKNGWDVAPYVTTKQWL